METCTQCGASLAEGDESCPSCGAVRDVGEEDAPRLAVVRPNDRDASDEPERIDDEVEDDDGTSVPAGTWAATNESESESPPASFGEPDTRRIRRLGANEAVGVERAEVRAEQAGAPRRPRGDSTMRGGRARGLAIATVDDTDPATSTENVRNQGRVVAFPGAARADASGKTATASTSGMRASGEIATPAGPPRWLASDLLRERLPAEPYSRTSRALGILAGVGGAIGVAVLGGEGGAHLGVAALLATIAAVAVAPLTFQLRAGAFAVLASLGLVIATMSRSIAPSQEVEGLATMGATLLAAAQLLRSVHRSSTFARAAMGVGIVVTAAWLALGGGLDAMVVTGTELEAWLEPMVRAVLLVVLALSVLGFLDDTGDSGCTVWPWLVLGWVALDAVVAIAAGTTASEIGAAATPLFATIAALGWMQVWSTTPELGRDTGRAKSDD